MKKVILVFILLIVPINVYAKKEEVKLEKCIDGDTISIKYKNNIEKVRFLAIDAPEIDKEEPYSIESKEFTCDILKNSKKIYIEFDTNSDNKDKYDRLLAWVWADDKLVQTELVKNGYAKVAYLYDEYKYTSDLKEFESYAKDKKLNIWSEYKPKVKKENKKSKKEIILDRISKSYEIIVLVIAGILALITLRIKIKK